MKASKRDLGGKKGKQRLQLEEQKCDNTRSMRSHLEAANSETTICGGRHMVQSGLSFAFHRLLLVGYLVSSEIVPDKLTGHQFMPMSLEATLHVSAGLSDR